MITTLANEYGYASSGESISIADKSEVWFLEIIGKAPKVLMGKTLTKELSGLLFEYLTDIFQVMQTRQG